MIWLIALILLLASFMKPDMASAACPIEIADINDDGIVNIYDLVAVQTWYLRSGFPPAVDTNSDGVINVYDLALVASWFLHSTSECQ